MTETNAKQELTRHITAFWVSQAIFVAAKLKVADHLAAGALSAGELATRIDCNADTLHRLLRALATVGIFAEDGAGRFALTPMAAYLRSGTPDSQRASALVEAEIQYAAWGELLHSVKTGESAFEKVHGQPFFEWLTSNPQQGEIFDGMMSNRWEHESIATVEAYDWPEPGEVVDVGGGAGGVLFTLLRNRPGVQGILFDQPEVVERTAAGVEDDALRQRCRFEGGDFFKAVPKGADVYVLRNIVHDWGDEHALRILKTCRDACPPSGKILLVEWVIEPGNEPSFGKWLDLTVLILLAGKERTEAEYRQLLHAAGLELVRILPTRTEMSIIEARHALK